MSLQLSPEESLDLLARAEYILSDNNEFDLITGNAIINKNYDVSKINDKIWDKKLELIGTNYE